MGAAPLLVASPSEQRAFGLARHHLLTFGVLLAILVGPLLFAAFAGERGCREARPGWRRRRGGYTGSDQLHRLAEAAMLGPIQCRSAMLLA